MDENIFECHIRLSRAIYIYIPITLKRSGTAPSDDTDHRSGYTIFTLIKKNFFLSYSFRKQKHKPCY